MIMSNNFSDDMFNHLLIRHGKLITEPIGMESEINDVRAAGSEELEW